MAALGSAAASLMQNLIIDKAKAACAPAHFSGVNIGLFDLGNAFSAWLGGLVIAYGLGFTSPNWAGGRLSIGGLSACYRIWLA